MQGSKSQKKQSAPRNMGKRQQTQQAKALSGKTQRRPANGRRQALQQRAPVALGNRTFQSRPVYRNMGENLSVTHSEYLGDVVGSTDLFSIAKSVAINPGLLASFPWLNQIASRYESYKFLKLNFRFMTESPTSTSGYVALIPDYDPTDPAPATKTAAFQYQGAAKCAPWENLVQSSSREDLSKRSSYFVRQGSLPANENLGLYDTGNLFVCVGGQGGASPLGELWCDYDVVLQTPQLDSNVGQADAAKLVGQTAVTAALPLGTNPIITYSRQTLFDYDGVTGALTFQIPFEGIFEYQLTGTTITACTLTSPYSPTQMTITDLGSVINSAGTSLLGRCLVSAPRGNPSYLAISPTAATVSACTMRVAPYAISLA